MIRLVRGVSVGVAVLTLVVGLGLVVGCGGSSASPAKPTENKMGDGKMGDGKMGDGKMGDGKMGDGKMGDGKMGDGKMTPAPK
jgi:uncharacterized low-complexity protein